MLLAGIGCVEDRQDIGPEVRPADGKAETAQMAQGERIEDIMANLEIYNGREVTVSGKVLPGLAFEFVGEQPYQIIQGESRLWVVTNDMAPKEGAFVTVTGRIAVPYQIKGRSYGFALLEKERQ
jgi:hypothetical protein